MEILEFVLSNNLLLLAYSVQITVTLSALKRGSEEHGRHVMEHTYPLFLRLASC